ncbi:MAG: hypothetical protein KC431_02230 [Myxococcales bacterium]|nr:hypothetical protein [Myxococcales bacterium]
MDFDEAWSSSIERQFAGLRVRVIGRGALLKNKRAAGRPKDVADVVALEEQGD